MWETKVVPLSTQTAVGRSEMETESGGCSGTWEGRTPGFLLTLAGYPGLWMGKIEALVSKKGGGEFMDIEEPSGHQKKNRIETHSHHSACLFSQGLVLADSHMELHTLPCHMGKHHLTAAPA